MVFFTTNTSESPAVYNLSEKSNWKSLTLQIMRIGIVSVALLLLTIQMLLALSVSSQEISKVQVRMELKNQSLSAAFKMIEKQTPFRFVYRKGELLSIPSRSITASTYTVEEALNLLLSNTNLTYKQVDQNLLILHNDQKASAEM